MNRYDDYSVSDEYYFDERRAPSRKRKRKKKRRIGCFVFLIILIAFFTTAAITNPTPYESEKIIKGTVLEYAEKYALKKAESGGVLMQAGVAMGMKLAPKLWDHAVKTEVQDYVFFSTFKADLDFKGINKNLLSGVIVFGYMIPLKSGIKDDLKELKY